MARSDFYNYEPNFHEWLIDTYYPRALEATKKRDARPAKRVLMWKDGYGVSRTAKEMGTEHLWNVMGFIRDRLLARHGGFSFELAREYAPFYFEAARELKARKVIPA